MLKPGVHWKGSRDTDFASLADAPNLARLRKALAELQAETIAVPPFAIKHPLRAQPRSERARSAAVSNGPAAARSNKETLPIIPRIPAGEVAATDPATRDTVAAMLELRRDFHFVDHSRVSEWLRLVFDTAALQRFSCPAFDSLRSLIYSDEAVSGATCGAEVR